MRIIFVCRPFVAEMKGIDKGFSVGEILAVPLTIAAFCRHCLAPCRLRMNIPWQQLVAEELH